MSRMQVNGPVASINGGFTLAELAATLAATAVVATLGVSAYRTHIVRAEIAHVIELSDPIKKRVAIAFHSLDTPPHNSDEAGILRDAPPNLTRYVAAWAIVDGRIDLTFGNGANPAIIGQRLSLTPFETASREIVWVCGNEIPGPELKPLGFAGGARQAVQVLTTVDTRYLPPACR